MTDPIPQYRLEHDSQSRAATLLLSGDWVHGAHPPPLAGLQEALRQQSAASLVVDGSGLTAWDSVLMAFLLQCHNHCLALGIRCSTRNLPEGAQRLLALATAVKAHEPAAGGHRDWLRLFSPLHLLRRASVNITGFLGFVGELAIAFGRFFVGRSNTRLADIRQFCSDAGPDAFAIISLTSVLVGMILAYLGAVQLQQFGAGIYVANLVVIGMLREMGVLMTAVVMAGRTGAAYAAQLGTMQTNEEIDAITTMGVSPMEFLVVPRILGLVLTMPLLTLYADILGILGGGIVAGGLGITPLQYFNQGESALKLVHLWVGLFKSVVYAVLIAIAGCRAGMAANRSSAGVGEAATEAVVTAVVYLIIADAAINIVFQQLRI